MSTQPHDQGLAIYKSSAGSGKTFTLVKEYLKLILAEPKLYRHILAVTFTVKATEEMKTRIIEKLGELATTSPDALPKVDMYPILKDHFTSIGKPKLDIQAKAKEALTSILNDYSNFSITTIESFFQRIVRAFARELNIPLGYDVELRQDLVLNQIITDTLLHVGENEELTQLFEGFVERNLDEEKSWNVDREVKSLGGEIFKESFQGLYLENIEHPSLTIPQTLKLSAEIKGIRKKFEQEMKVHAETALQMVEEAGLTIDDFHYGKSGVMGYFRGVLRTQEYAPKARARKAYEDLEGWIGKKKKENTPEVEALVLGGLWDALRAMIDLYDSQFEAYNTALQISRTIYSYGVLNTLQDQLTEYRRQNAQLLISDTNRLITDIIHEQFDTPFIYEKVGTRFRHYLLDEFQDTSQMQWTNILPLLREALAYGQQSLLVGDVKQSIYRWRNGDWKLLLQKVETDISQSNIPPRLEFLDTNYRTVEEIVHFNNTFFEQAAQLLSLGLQNIDVERQDIFQMAYEKVAQKARYHKEGFPGWVSVEFFKHPSPKDEMPPWQEQALDRLLEILQDLPEQGFQLGDVCLLVRTNRDGITIAEFLQKHDISVVSAESLLLISDPKVRFLLALLAYINQEDDPIAAAALRYYYGQIHEGHPPDHGVFTTSSHLEDKVVPPEIREKLRQKSVYECVEQAIALFPDLQTPNAYLTGFLNVVLEFTASVDASIGGFLEWWGDEQHKRSIHATPNPHAVQIMTIHKSKGLEFPIVILPFADWAMAPSSRGIMWVQSDQAPYDQFPFLPVHPSTKLENSFFRDQYQEELLASQLDNLNLLYVAQTRAKYRLYLLSKLPGKSLLKNGHNKPFARLADLVYLSLAEMEPQEVAPEGEEPIMWHWGSPVHADKVMKRKKTHDLQTLSLKENPHARQVWTEKIRVKYQFDPQQRMSMEQRASAVRQGNLLHDALAHVQTRADIPAAAQKIYLQGAVDEAGRAQLVRQMETVTQHLGAFDWYGENWQVKNEADIISSDGQLLRPDRVMLQGQHALVVDYKTGAPSGSHVKQLKRYIQTLQEMGYRPVQGYIYYLNLGQIDEVKG